ncbi:MAG: hypothetical protein JXB10_17880 [Pirellulales bacterium]|nr:hypothetical protein [Pirellulales bacterium]
MSRKLRWGLIGLGGLIGTAAIVLFGLYLAVRHEPKFYRDAMQADPADLEKGSQQMLQRCSLLFSDVQKDGRWEAVFTAEQINGWLAADFVRNHPGTLPPTMRDPRVEITPKDFTVACRYEKDAFSYVLSLTVQPYVPQSSPSGQNVLALRIVYVRAGLLPLPLNNFLKAIRNSVQRSGCRLQWRITGGDPVALITFPSPDKNAQNQLSIETIQLDEGNLYVAGNTQRNPP